MIAKRTPGLCATSSGVLLAVMVGGADAAQAADAAVLYKQRCGGCHEATMPGIPSRAQLRIRPQASIVHALSHGVMKPQANGLTAFQISALAAHLGAPKARTAPSAKAKPKVVRAS